MIVFSAEQADALKEIANVAMGRAGDALARLLDVFVRLSVPSVSLVESKDVMPAVTRMIGASGPVSAVRQTFSSQLQGEAIAIFGEAGCRDLADLMGHEEALDPATEEELLLDVCNILVGACVCGIAEQLSYELSFSAPSVIVRGGRLDQLMNPSEIKWSHTLLINVDFRIENRAFVCHVLAFWPAEAILLLQQAIDRFLESLS